MIANDHKTGSPQCFLHDAIFSTLQEDLTFNTVEESVGRILDYYLRYYTVVYNVFAIFAKQC